jgi:phage terminase small subunit
LELLATVIYARLRDEGLITESGEPKKLLGEYRSVRHSQLAIAKELGLTPAARRQLAESGKGLDLAAEFAKVAEEPNNGPDGE